ncbi:MAG: hypothetical protein ACOC42_01425 [Halobacteriota archaeon]
MSLADLERPTVNRTVAYVYLTILFGLPVAAAIAAVALGWVTVDLHVEATLAIGWLLEYAVIGFVVLVAYVTVAMVVRVVGTGFTRSLGRVVLRFMDGFNLPEEEDGE